MPVFHLPHSILVPHRSHNVLRDTHLPFALVEHYFTGDKRRASPLSGRVPTTFRAPLPPLSYGRKRFALPLEPLVTLVMHYGPSITSPASQHPQKLRIFTTKWPPLLFALPHQSLGSPLRNWPPRNHPPTPPSTHFVRSPTSSLAYRLAFVIISFYLSSDL